MSVLPVKPPPSTIGQGTRAAIGCLIIVTVKGGEEEVIVRWEAIRRIALVVKHLQPVVVLFRSNAVAKRKGVRVRREGKWRGQVMER